MSDRCLPLGRTGYSALLRLALPLLLLRVLWRGRREPGYRRHLAERLGRYARAEVTIAPGAGAAGAAEPAGPRPAASLQLPPAGDPPRGGESAAANTASGARSEASSLPVREEAVAQPQPPATPPLPSGRGRLAWLHAVSVGETQAARPLVEALLASGWRVLLTHMTPTGRATAAALFGDRVRSVYLPWDTPGGAERFLEHFCPAVGAILETELWPNLIARCRARGVPLWLVNARLSERSAAGYRRLPYLTGEALAGLAGVLAQDEADAARLRALGAPRVEVTGNLKFDVRPDAALVARGRAWRASWGGRPVWVAASTRDGEESDVLAALQSVDPSALLVLVPRHPQRFDAVADAVAAAGLGLARRSAEGGVEKAADPAIRVLLGDSMGEMPAWYAAADLAFVGGSLRPFGGQNLIEPCAIGCPVLVGPHTWNFREAALRAVEAGAALRVADAADLGETVAGLLCEPQRREAMAAAGLRFALAHRGAAERTLQAMLPA